MSTYGGGSWVPDAMHRKHQVDQVLADVHQLDRYSNHWRRLSNGRIACLVCPHRPVLDTMPMLIIHRKGAKHQAAALKYEEKDFCLQNEIQKRTALEASKASNEVGSTQRPQSSYFPACSPLLEATRKRTAQALAMPDDSKVTGTADDVSNTKQKIDHGTLIFLATPSQAPTCPVNVIKTSASTTKRQSKLDKQKHGRKGLESEVVTKEDQDWRHERERILRLREAGWRLDGNGKWFRDESVEFDSDEEVPADLAAPRQFNRSVSSGRFFFHQNESPLSKFQELPLRG